MDTCGALCASISARAQLAALEMLMTQEQRAQINLDPAEGEKQAHSTAQGSAAQRSAAQHSTAQHSTAQHSTAQHREWQSRHSLLQTADSPAPTRQGLTHEVSASVYLLSLYCSSASKCCSLRMKRMIVQSTTALPSVVKIHYAGGPLQTTVRL